MASNSVFGVYDLYIFAWIKEQAFCQANSICTEYVDAALEAYMGIRNPLSQAFFGIVLTLFFLGLTMMFIVWDWLPISFRLLFMGKPSDYDWNTPYTY